MNQHTNPTGTRLQRGLCALALAATLGLASPALGEAQGSAGIVLQKDAAAKTLTLASGTVLHVSSRTIITGAEGQRIGFDAIPAAAPTDDGGFEVDGDEGISYEADGSQGKSRATRIRVLSSIPD